MSVIKKYRSPMYFKKLVTNRFYYEMVKAQSIKFSVILPTKYFDRNLIQNFFY